MQRVLRAFFLAAAFLAATPSTATVITGADGLLALTTDYTLPYRADGIFDFSSIDIGTGVTLRFEAGMSTVTLLSLGDINILGTIYSPSSALTIETPGRINFSGTIATDSLAFVSGADGIGFPTLPDGAICMCSRVGPLPVFPPFVVEPPLQAILVTVPEPGTLWLITTLGIFVVFRRKRWL